MGDVNGRLLSFGQSVSLKVRLTNKLYRVKLIMAERLTVEVIIGTAFLNHKVFAILCTEQRIRLKRGELTIVKQLSGLSQEGNAQY